MDGNNLPDGIVLNTNSSLASARPFLFVFAIIFIAVPLIFICLGISMMMKQDAKFNTFIKTNAHVVSSSVDAVWTSRGKSGRGSSTYTPLVTFEYDVNGKHYVSSSPLLQSYRTSDRSWAERIVDKFHAGVDCSAYYNPSNPADAYLLRQHEFFPYFVVVFPMIHLTCGLIVLLYALGVFGTSRARLTALPGGWSSIYPDYSLANRRLFAVIFSLWWFGVGTCVLGRYFIVAAAETPFNAWSVATTAIYCLIGMAGLRPAIRWTRVLHEMSEPKVKMRSGPVKRGESVPVEVELRTRRELKIKDIQIGVLCHDTSTTSSGGKTSTSTVLVYELWQTVPENHNFRAEQKVTAAGEIVVPTSGPADMSFASGTHSYQWSVGVRVHVEQGADYSGKFPIAVQ